MSHGVHRLPSGEDRVWRAMLFVLAAIAQLLVAPILARAYAFEDGLCAADHSASGQSSADCQKACCVFAAAPQVSLLPPSAGKVALRLHAIGDAVFHFARAASVRPIARTNRATGPPPARA